MKNIKQFISNAENPAVLNMFVENSYIALNGKENPMYVMNRDGFTLLAMGVTGQKTISGHFHKQPDTKQISLHGKQKTLKLK